MKGPSGQASDCIQAKSKFRGQPKKYINGISAPPPNQHFDQNSLPSQNPLPYFYSHNKLQSPQCLPKTLVLAVADSLEIAILPEPTVKAITTTPPEAPTLTLVHPITTATPTEATTMPTIMVLRITTLLLDRVITLLPGALVKVEDASKTFAPFVLWHGLWSCLSNHQKHLLSLPLISRRQRR